LVPEYILVPRFKKNAPHQPISFTQKTPRQNMKNLYLAAAGMLCLLTACNNASQTTGNDSMAQKNLDAMHIVNKAFETGDISHIDDAVAADFVDHTDQGDKGRDSLKAMITQMHKSGMTMKVDVMKEIADSNYAFEMMRYSGNGDGMMMPAGPYEMHAVEVVRFKDGKGVEHWSYVSMSEIMKMMSHMQGAQGQAPAAMAKADTAKKK
jgi:predicted SnoaL-like aldol condensation-catalyzing enzyme